MADRARLDRPPGSVELELYRLRCTERVAEFKAELACDRAVVEWAIDEAFQEIERQEGGQR